MGDYLVETGDWRLDASLSNLSESACELQIQNTSAMIRHWRAGKLHC